ncbi:MAG: hypothetical protein Q9220_003823 [cf. Caloplaca sp. 1 TL-2023]
MSQSYIEAHKAEEAVRALEAKVSLLMIKNKDQAGKNEAFEKKLHALETKNLDLETRLKASPKENIRACSSPRNSEHNALSRHLNALLPPLSPHTPLHQLHSIHTNTPLKSHPKKESDIRTLSSLDVTALLKDLDAAPEKGSMSAGDKKARLKELLGVGERSSVATAVVGNGEVEGMVDGVEKKKEEGGKKVEKKLPGKATGPPPGKVLPVGPKG